MTVRPSGTVTFLFTDIEGSTQRWEADPDTMRAALAVHDDVLRSAIEAHGGWMFKHTGDGVCAAFSSAKPAVEAAIAAQRQLELPVRMGIATGEAEQRGDDYFGPALNRAARIMAVGHGGQALVASVTAGLVSGIDLADLGEHRLRDLSGAERLFQIRADGLRAGFPALRTIDAVPGNLPRQATSFVGRAHEVTELLELVRAHQLVTLTGVGGVGKTRLAVHVAAELVPEFPDGVWLVQLAPVGDPAAVPDAVATAMGIAAQPGRSVAKSVADAVVGRRLLIVVDNCEHVLDAAADLIEAILAQATTVTVVATSREGLRVGAEHLWPVPSLDVRDGAGSAAVELFVERARAGTPGFSLAAQGDVDAVTEICRRLDGIALAIELAAARMVSMTPAEVLTRLNDRFRLLSGSRRGLERHQTLRQAVQWSYDLLTRDEQAVLAAAAVFAGVFDAASVVAVCEEFDEYTMLDLLDSLVRKSLITVAHSGGRTRYGMLETIRQFSEDQHAASGGLGELRDRHARRYAVEAIALWNLWDGPGYDEATEWEETEFDNLRAGFRWAADREDLATAVAIAAHTTMLGLGLQQYEPIAWAEELLPAAVAANVPQLPRLYTAATNCFLVGRAEDGVKYGQAAVALQNGSAYEPFADGCASSRLAIAESYRSRFDSFIEISEGLSARSGSAQVVGLCGVIYGYALTGRAAEARSIADETLQTARAHGNPFYVAYALLGCGLVSLETDPGRSLEMLREGLGFARKHRMPVWEAVIGREAAAVEAVHGDFDRALDLFAACITSLHQAGDTLNLGGALLHVADCFVRIGWNDIASPLAATGDVIGTEAFDAAVRTGAAMTVTDAVHFALDHLARARGQKP